MTKYKNLGGKSEVTHYKIDKDAVTVDFTSCGRYIYSNQSAGSANVKQMKELAVAGKGLGTFIEKAVKHLYARKIR